MDEQNINNNNQNIENGAKKEQKNYFLVAVLFLIAALAYSLWLWQKSANEDMMWQPNMSIHSNTEQQNEISTNDTTTVINNELNNIDLTDLDAEFQEIDADLNSL